jgi:ankyrin repeat protein
MGRTLFHFACEEGELELVTMLLELGAVPYGEDKVSLPLLINEGQ